MELFCFGNRDLTRGGGWFKMKISYPGGEDREIKN
jgi:hypothetical protein